MTMDVILERAAIPAAIEDAILAAKTIADIEAVFADLFRVVPVPPNGPSDYRDVRSDFGLKVRGIKARENLNAMARDILERVHDPADLTEEDAAVLKQYSGRGGLTENSQFEYYTPTGVAEGIWDALRMHGFENGNVLDPCVGAGVFPATKPQGVVMTGTDIDPVGSKIAQLFNPDDQVKTGSFEAIAAATEDDHFDAVTGNVPFGDARGKSMHDDPAYKSEKRIERYFLLRAHRQGQARRPGLPGGSDQHRRGQGRQMGALAHRYQQEGRVSGRAQAAVQVVRGSGHRYRGGYRGAQEAPARPAGPHRRPAVRDPERCPCDLG